MPTDNRRVLDVVRPPGFGPEAQKFLRSVAPQLMSEGLRGAAESAFTGTVGAPVDLATMALRPFGYDNPSPVMGSDWIRQKMQDLGVYGERTGTGAERTGEVLGDLFAPGPGELASLGALGGIIVGPNAAQIRNPTGDWFDLPGQPGKRGIEISDKGAKLDKDWSNTLGKRQAQNVMAEQGWESKVRSAQEYGMPFPNREEYLEAMERMRPGSTKPPTVGDVFQHPDLYAAYPDLAEIPLKYEDTQRLGAAAYYQPGAGPTSRTESLGMGGGLQPTAKTHMGLTADEVLFHELEHAISPREGWAGGASPRQFHPTELPQVLHGYQGLVEDILKPTMANIGYTGSPEALLAAVRTNKLSPEVAQRLEGYGNAQDIRDLAALQGELQNVGTGSQDLYGHQAGEVSV